MGRKSKAVQITKTNLQTAFWELYQKKPLEQISVRAITESAGYNRGTFYVYYKDVRDILDQLEDRLLAEIEKTIHEFFPEYIVTDKVLLQFFIHIYQLHNDYIPKLMSPSGDPQFYNRMIAKLQPFVAKFFELHSSFNALQRDYATEYLLSSCFFMFSRWYAHKQDLSVEELINLMLVFFEHGLLGQWQ